MPKPRPPLQHPPHRLPLKHPLPPRLNPRPILHIDAQKGKHPGHGEREVRYIRDSRPVGECDEVLAGEGEAGFEDGPLGQDVGVESGV